MPLMKAQEARTWSRHTIKSERKVLNKTANQIRQSMSMTQKTNNDSRVYSAVKNKNNKSILSKPLIGNFKNITLSNAYSNFKPERKEF